MYDTQPKGLSGLLIKIGLVKNHGQAQIAMVIIAVICILLAVLSIGGESPGEKYGNYNEMKEQHPELFD